MEFHGLFPDWSTFRYFQPQKTFPIDQPTKYKQNTSSTYPLQELKAVQTELSELKAVRGEEEVHSALRNWEANASDAKLATDSAPSPGAKSLDHFELLDGRGIG